jgi:hypothetical protein
MKNLKVERTGRQYSIASSEYLITFPDGTQETIWSPPWHEYTEEEEDKRTLYHAMCLWEDKGHDLYDIVNVTSDNIQDWQDVE